MTDVLHHPMIHALAWALAHFVWQGAAIGLVAAAAYRLARGSASARYAIGVVSLAAMLAAPAVTLAWLAGAPAAGDPGLAVGAAAAAPDAALTIDLVGSAPIVVSAESAGAPDWLALAVLGWLLGVAVFSLRLVGGWIVARRYVGRAVQPAADHLQTLAREVAGRLGVRRTVTVLQSAAVAVPVMMGWFKPTIVLPLAALSGLSPTQVEALLAHELAHVRRYDYLVNLVQSAAEALLFYHPAVWWVSRRVRADRELCCDDLTIAVCDRLVYATALTDLATLASPGLALAATDGDLVGRVRRILGRADERPVVRAGVMPLLVIALVAGLVIPATLASATGAPAAGPAGDGDAVVARMVPAAPQTAPTPTPTSTPAPRPATTVKPAAAPQTSPTPTPSPLTEEYQKKLEEARAKLEAARREAEVTRQAALDRTRTALEQARAAHEAELAAARKRYEEARQQFDAGLISETQLLEAKAALARVEAGSEALAAELLAARANLARTQTLVERGLIAPGTMVDIEQVMKTLESRLATITLSEADLAKAVQALRDKNLKNLTGSAELSELLAAKGLLAGQDQAKLRIELDAMRASIDKMVAGQVITRNPLPADAKVQAGDLLRLTISGEPDLPATYRVSDDGTIRLPFLGAIKVVGLTAAQIRDAVGKQLSDRRLGSASQVTVTVTRGLKGVVIKAPDTIVIK
jgi:beta-lactamase regulating signal transducer with metallopeptidase domain